MAYLATIPREYSRRRRFFVIFSLGNLDGRLFGNMADQKIHQNIFAVVCLFNGLQHQWTQPLRVQIIVIFMIKGGAGQHDRVLVRPFGRVTPRILQYRREE